MLAAPPCRGPCACYRQPTFAQRKMGKEKPAMQRAATFRRAHKGVVARQRKRCQQRDILHQCRPNVSYHSLFTSTPPSLSFALLTRQFVATPFGAASPLPTTTYHSRTARRCTPICAYSFIQSPPLRDSIAFVRHAKATICLRYFCRRHESAAALGKP